MDPTALGFGLNVSQRLAVKTSLARIRVNENYPATAELAFWGKITGTIKDYLVVQAVVTKESLIEKSYYFSIDGGNSFAKMPLVDAFIQGLSPKIRGLFTGDPNKKLRDPAHVKRDEDGNPVEEEEEEEEEEEPEEDEDDLDEDGEKKEKKPKERRLTEIERLAHTVQLIDRDTCVVPRGTFQLTATGTIVRNDGFKGLAAGDLSKMGSYALFRHVEDAKTMAKVRQAGVCNNSDFLDGLSESKGEWVIRVTNGGTAAVLRNLVWPGYEFVIETPLGASATPASLGSGAYFGTGEKNADLAFMV